MKGMTLEEPCAREDDTLEKAVLFQRLYGIVGTGGIKTTGVHQKGGNKLLIQTDCLDQQPFDHFRFRMRWTAFSNSVQSS